MIEEKIRLAVTPTVPICIPNRYDGTATEYCVFTYAERGALFGDDTAGAIVYSVMLHYYLPHGVDPNTKKRAIRSALVSAGATFPTITNAGDDEGQHYVYEFQMTEGEA